MKKRLKIISRKGGDPKPKRGKPVTIRKPGEEILPNGLFQRQWSWAKREGERAGMTGAQYLRWAFDIHINNIESSRSGPIATKEDDEKFEKLIKVK